MSTQPTLRSQRDGSQQISLVTVAAAAASGLGVLGFVVFAGGVVLWRRFSEMGLPADHAVALVPKAELITTGAEFLAPALLLAAAMTLVVLFSSKSKERRRVILLILIVEVSFAIASYSTVHLLGCLILLIVAVVGAVVSAKAVHLHLSGFALVAFLAVGAFWIARAYERTSHAPTVLPMAYSRAQPGIPARVETGYFVAETADRIYFASLPQGDRSDHLPNELRAFPRSETDDIEVGNLVSVANAEASASRFAYNLCSRLLALAGKQKSLKVTPCSSKQMSELKAASERR